MSEDKGEVTRKPVAAGRFYPADRSKLAASLADCLRAANERYPSAGSKRGLVRGLMVPHAGYTFSGAVAAAAYKLVSGRRLGTVYLLGNAHYASFEGVAADDSSFWETPLGRVAVDRERAGMLASGRRWMLLDAMAHANDHVLETQIPFLQTVAEAGFRILPLLIGFHRGEKRMNGLVNELAEAIGGQMGSDDIVIASSDLSHYPQMQVANIIDQKTMDMVKTLDAGRFDKHIGETMSLGIKNLETAACGADALKTLMRIARERSWSPTVLAYANSGDCPEGTESEAVGYGSAAFLEREAYADIEK